MCALRNGKIEKSSFLTYKNLGRGKKIPSFRFPLLPYLFFGFLRIILWKTRNASHTHTNKMEVARSQNIFFLVVLLHVHQINVDTRYLLCSTKRYKKAKKFFFFWKKERHAKIAYKTEENSIILWRISNHLSLLLCPENIFGIFVSVSKFWQKTRR